MEHFFQIVGGVMIAVILGIALAKQGKETAMILTAVVCCMVLTAMASYLEPVLEFVQKLHQLGQMDMQLLEILLKAVGIGLVGELAALICTDSGNGALGKAVQILSSAVILWISLPLMNALIDLVQSVLGEV